jgi:shikimate kinase
VDEAWLANVAAERQPLYESVADQVVDVDDRDVDDVTRTIVAAVGAASTG